MAAWCEAAGDGNHGFVFDSSHPVVPDTLAALDWALENEVELAYRIIRGLGWIRQHLGHYAELERHYEVVIAVPAERRTPGWARAVAGLMMPSIYLGRADFDQAVGPARHALPAGDSTSLRLLDTFEATNAALAVLDISGLQRCLEEAMLEGDRMGGVQLSRMVCAHLMAAGRFDEVRSATDALAALLATRSEALTSENSSMAYAALMCAQLEQGRLSEARRLALAIRPERQSVTGVVSGMIIA